MSFQTSGLPDIGATGSGNSAYISGLVMMDVMMRRRKRVSVRCGRWDRPFSLPSLLSLCNSCRADWCVTPLVPSDSLFPCAFLVSS